MATVSEMRKRVEALNLEKEAEAAVNETAAYAEDLITDQLRQGKDGNGDFLPEYSKTSIEVFHKPPGPIKLFDQGDYYHGVTYEAKNGRLISHSTDSKDEMLAKEYGPAILKMSAESREEYIKGILYDTYADQVRDKTGMK